MVRQKRHELLVRAAYDLGVSIGWDNCWQMRQAKILRNLTPEIKRDLEKLLSKKARSEMSPELSRELNELLKGDNNDRISG